MRFRRPTRTSKSTAPYRSKFEQRIAADLEARGVSFGYEDKKFEYVLPPKKYLTDFRLGDLYVEAKGYFTSADRTKLLQVRKAHPNVDIRLLFQNASNKLNKKSKTTYAMWADKHGFKWAEGRIPPEWLDND